MQVELKENIVEFKFNYAQAEITGKCNMNCDHCRAHDDPKEDMTIETFNKLLDFCDFDENFNFTISGGEPFLHPGIYSFLDILKNKNVNEVAITTNGSLIDESVIKKLLSVNLSKLIVQISIDSIHPSEHDNFRHYEGAFSKAVETVKLLLKNNIFTSIRISLTKQTLQHLEEFVKLAIKIGVKRVGLSCVVPAGNALDNKNILLGANDKKELFFKMNKLKKKYPEIEIVTGDPIKFFADFHEKENTSNLGADYRYYGGCEAGITGINSDSLGNITPCALLPINLVNINDHSTSVAQQLYVKNESIKALFERDLEGKCGKCELKWHCGGCRAIPYGLNGNLMGEDPTCFHL